MMLAMQKQKQVAYRVSTKRRKLTGDRLNPDWVSKEGQGKALLFINSKISWIFNYST